MKRYCQLDNRWASDTLGHTKYTIGRWGCTTTAICMLYTRFHKEHYLPPKAAKDFTYTPTGLLYWSSEFKGMEFKGRFYGVPDKRTLKEYMTKRKGIIIEVNHNHWVVGYFNGFLGLFIIDPLDGKVKRLPSRYRPTGYATFIKK